MMLLSSDSPLTADLWLLNSCTVKGPSEDSLNNSIRKGRELGKPLVISGCVPQGQRDQLDVQGLSVVGVRWSVIGSMAPTPDPPPSPIPSLSSFPHLFPLLLPPSLPSPPSPVPSLSSFPHPFPLRCSRLTVWWKWWSRACKEELFNSMGNRNRMDAKWAGLHWTYPRFGRIHW